MGARRKSQRNGVHAQYFRKRGKDSLRGKKRARGSEGVALILVMLAILVLSTLAAAMVFSARAETLASYNFKIGAQAEYAARAGIQKAVNFFNNNTLYASLSPTSGPPAPVLTYTTTGHVPAGDYDVVVTMMTGTGHETAPSPRTTITLPAVGGIHVTSPGSQSGFTRYRVYAGPSGGTLIYRTTTDLGTDYTIEVWNSTPDVQGAAIPANSTTGSFPAGTYYCGTAITSDAASGGIRSPLSPVGTITMDGSQGLTVSSPPVEPGVSVAGGATYDVYCASGASQPSPVTSPSSYYLQGQEPIGTNYVNGAYVANPANVYPGDGNPPTPTPTAVSGGGSMVAGTYYVAVSLVDSSGKEWWQTTPASVSVSSGGAIKVGSPTGAAPATVTNPPFSLYRVYAGPTPTSLYIQSTVALGTSYTITPLAQSMSPPATTAPGLNPYYKLSIYSTNPVNMYFTDSTPVSCSSNCSHSGDVTLGLTSGGSNYPPASATLDANGHSLDVVSNWVKYLGEGSSGNGQVTPDPTTAAYAASSSTGEGTGNYTVTATLLDYHTVNNAYFGVPDPGCSDPSSSRGICRQPYEVWQITSTGTWNNNIGAVGAAEPTVVLQTTIAPFFLPYFGNALYGLCSVKLSGNVCTDSYNSTAGNYGGADPASCAEITTLTGNNASASDAGIGSNGGITLSGTALSIGGDVTYANQSPCDTGFQGNDSGVAGSVLPGPAVPTPAVPDMVAWGYAATGSSPCSPVPTGTPCPPYKNNSAIDVQPPKVGSANYEVSNVFLKSTPPPAPPGISASCSAPTDGGTATAFIQSYTMNYPTNGGAVDYTGSYSCQGYSAAQIGSGTSGSPFTLGNINSNISGNAVINLVVPSGGQANAVTVAANSIDGSGGMINMSDQPPPIPASVSKGWTYPAPNNQNGGMVLDVGNTVKLGGTSNLNYNSATPGVPSPDLLDLNILGPIGSGTSCTLSMTGQAQISGMITVPYGNSCIGGSGSAGTFFGSLLSYDITDSGGYAVHYDTAMKQQSGKLYPSRVISISRPQM